MNARRTPCRLLLLTLMTGLVIGCDDPESPEIVASGPVTDQPYLFDIYYVNFAWGYQLSGTYIDNLGNVVTYNHSFERWVAEDYNNLTLAELEEKYSALSDTVGVIDRATLLRAFGKIEAASLGELSERVHTANDAGGSSFNAYRYDPDSGRHARVLLSLTGDFTQTNLSAEAVDLQAWLQSVLQDVHETAGPERQ